MNGCRDLISFFMRRFVSTLVATSYQNELTGFLLAKEDCAARSLLKRETQDKSGEADNLKGDEDSDPDSDDDKDIEERGKKASTAHIGTLHCTGRSDSRNAYSVADDPSSRGPVNPRISFYISKLIYWVYTTLASSIPDG